MFVVIILMSNSDRFQYWCVRSSINITANTDSNEDDDDSNDDGNEGHDNDTDTGNGGDDGNANGKS